MRVDDGIFLTICWADGLTDITGPFQGPKHERSNFVKDINDMLPFDSRSAYVSQSTVGDWNEWHWGKASPCPNTMLKQDKLAFNKLLNRE